MSSAADRFVDLACLTYSDEESRARRAEASALLAASPELVRESVHAAAAAGDAGALRVHLDGDPACVARVGSPRSWVPLLALCYGRVDQVDALACLDLLLGRGADPNAHVMLGDCKFTALTGVMGEGENGPFEQPPHPAARAMAERLLDAGADPNDAQGLYNTHFLPSTAWLELLLARGLSSAADLEFSLGQAVVCGHAERVRLLLARGVNPDGRHHYNKRPHLENAYLHGDAEIVRLFVDAGARPPVFDGGDRLCAAVLANDAGEAARLLAAHPALGPRCGALLAAARHGHLDALRLGLSLGLPVDGCDHQGLTALHLAARGGHLEAVRILLAHGASRAIRDRLYDGTPLGHTRYFNARWPREHGAAIEALLA